MIRHRHADNAENQGMEGSAAAQGGGDFDYPPSGNTPEEVSAHREMGVEEECEPVLFAISYIIPSRAARMAMAAALLLPWGSEKCFYTALPKSCPHPAPPAATHRLPYRPSGAFPSPYPQVRPKCGKGKVQRRKTRETLYKTE